MEEKLLEIKDKISRLILPATEMSKKISENEVVTLLGDTSKVISIIRGTTQYFVEKKFQRFLEGFNEEEQPLENQLNKLLKYVDNEKHAVFISSVFNNVMLANSSKATLIMGTILHEIVSAGSELDHNKLIAINALTTMYDIDIENIRVINEFIDEVTDVIYPPRFNRYCTDNGYDYISINLTIEKCIPLQILSVDYLADVRQSMGRIGTADRPIHPHFIVAPPGKLLMGYIKRTEIIRN